jgi:SAM-dependent methyltransferase
MLLDLDLDLVRPCFGAGGGEPYEHALRVGAPMLLHAERLDGASAPAPRPVDIQRFMARADRVERRLLASTRGSVLDVGCGPGRMVAEALRAGRRALGLDVSPGSVRLVAERGLPVHLGSVFDDVPGAGSWDVVLLLDGNVGIGGDPAALLRRCADIGSPGARLVVETAEERGRDRRFTARVSTPGAADSAGFPWAEVGADALLAPATHAGWRPVREVRRRGRSFVVLARSLPPERGSGPVDVAGGRHGDVPAVGEGTDDVEVGDVSRAGDVDGGLRQ